jgi:hypothetical protein
MSRLAHRYVLSVLIALDQLVNALFGGYADETVSFRAATARKRGERWGCVLCKLLDWIDPNHCSKTLLNKKVSILKRKMAL